MSEAGVEEVGVVVLGGGAGAFDRDGGGSKVEVSADGSLVPVKAELLALARADGFRGRSGWEAAGGGARSYRVRIERHPVFQARVEKLMSEREKIVEQEGAAGEAIWAVRQNWRLARAGGDVAQIHRATVLLVETTKSLLGVQPAPVGGEAAVTGDGEVRPVGRPPKVPAALRVDALQMRERLVQRGIALPMAAE